MLEADVNIAARVADAAKAGDVLVSDAVVERIDMGALRAGRPKRLRADGAPRSARLAAALTAPTSCSRRRFLPVQDSLQSATGHPSRVPAL